MIDAPYLVELRLLGSSEHVRIPLLKEPGNEAVAHLLATKLFDELRVVDTKINHTLFEIRGPRIPEYGELVLGAR